MLTGRGKSFCAGIDLGNPVDAVKQAADDSEDYMRKNPVKAMEAFTRPIIGAINGPAITGGFEIALACDILIGSTSARFRDTHGIVGIVPCWGLSQKLSRIVGSTRARFISLTASQIGAKQAEEWGLLTAVFEPELLLGSAIALAEQIAGLNDEVVRQYKATITDGLALPLGEALSLERRRASKQYASLGQRAFAGQAKSALEQRHIEGAAHGALQSRL